MWGFLQASNDNNRRSIVIITRLQETPHRLTMAYLLLTLCDLEESNLVQSHSNGLQLEKYAR